MRANLSQRKETDPIHLNTTQCCMHTFTARDIKPPLMNQKKALGTDIRGLYGNNAKWFANTACPDCGKPYLLWLMPVSKGYKVLTISAVEVPESADPGETGGDQDGEPILWETATKEQLRAYLKQKGVSYFNGASEDQLREIVAETVMAH